MPLTPGHLENLAADIWQEMDAAHRQRAARYTTPCRDRRARGLPHPIEDFLFEYYPFPCSLLDNWHPGHGFALDWKASPFRPPFTPRHHRIRNGWLFADPDLLSDKEILRLGWIRDLLVATRGRPGNFACHGLHEWAMVYQGHDIRHAETTPLRLPQSAIDQLVESRPICCSHHDAFRFFTPHARPLNRLQPSFETRELHEQPGCIHANMDLYKWAAKCMPWIGTDLLLDCFESAMKLRKIDMRASPYDLTRWGLDPIRIETPEGRAEYETAQRQLAQQAAPLRNRLIDSIESVLATRTSHPMPPQLLPQGLVK